MSSNDYEVIFSVFKDAFSHIEDNMLVHKQDIFLRQPFDESELKGDSFLSESKRKRFEGTEYMEHRSFLTFSISQLDSLEKAYIANPLNFKQDLHIRDKKLILDFQKQVKTVVAKLNQVAGFTISEATPTEIKECLFNYYTLFGEGSIVRDFWSEGDYLTNGKKKICGYALTDERQVPKEIKLYSKDRKFRTVVESNEDNELKFLQTMFCEDFGISLKYTHVLNQFWKFNKKYVSEFEATVSKFKRYRGFSKDLNLLAVQQDKLLDQVKNNNSILSEYGFNILLIEDEKHFLNAKEEIEDTLNSLLPKIYQPTGAGIDNLFFGSMIGFENHLNSSFFFLTDLETALSFNTFGSQQKGDDQGILFNERITNSPIEVDLWSKPFGIPIKARNGIIISSTGGGKSVLALNIIRQHIESGTKVIVLEIGKSFELLTKIYKEQAVHIKYSANSDIGFNPFKLEEGQTEPDHNQADQICDLIVRFLQQNTLKVDKTAEKKTIEQLVNWYYQQRKEEKVHSFDTFYSFVEDRKSFVVSTIDITYFNVERFLLVCKDFIKGGRYEKLSREGDSSIFNKDLIVIELSDIKGNPFLFGYLMYILTLLIESILMNRGVKSLFFIDEYGEIQDKETDQKDDFNIHATTAYCYQKLRKENSACYLAIQHAKQMKDDTYTQTILTQADLLFVPETGEDIYKQIIEVFGIDDTTMQNLMFSMNSHKGAGIPIKEAYTEIFVSVAKSFAKVVRLCLSEEEYYCYQTDGDIWKRMSSRLNKGVDIQKAVSREVEIKDNPQMQEEDNIELSKK